MKLITFSTARSSVRLPIRIPFSLPAWRSPRRNTCYVESDSRFTSRAVRWTHSSAERRVSTQGSTQQHTAPSGPRPVRLGSIPHAPARRAASAPPASRAEPPPSGTPLRSRHRRVCTGRDRRSRRAHPARVHDTLLTHESVSTPPVTAQADRRIQSRRRERGLATPLGAEGLRGRSSEARPSPPRERGAICCDAARGHATALGGKSPPGRMLASLAVREASPCGCGIWRAQHVLA